jgi:hypothetical protein
LFAARALHPLADSALLANSHSDRGSRWLLPERLAHESMRQPRNHRDRHAIALGIDVISPD